MQILRPRRKKMFLNQVKNIFASRTQMLYPGHMFPSLATQETSQETMFQQQCFLVYPGPIINRVEGMHEVQFKCIWFCVFICS